MKFKPQYIIFSTQNPKTKTQHTINKLETIIAIIMIGNGQSGWAWSQTVPPATAGTDGIGEKEKSRSLEKNPHKKTCDFQIF